MTPLELMTLAKPLADLYTGLETDLIKNIADFLLTQNLESSTAKWKINKLAQLGALDKANIKTISEYAGVVPNMLAIALESASLTAINELEPGFKELVKEGILKATTVPIDTSMANIIKTFYEQATEKYNLVNTVMKYKAKSTAQKIINDTAELANKQEFLDILNKATGKVVTGIESRRTALSQCIKEMCQKGIPAFTDKLGREWSPEAYVNMDIRTTCSNVANKSQFKRMDDYGVSLIEISSHNGARPKCAKYQGTIVDRSGKSKKYRSLKDTSYGEPDGLFGINCGHKPYPFIEGVSIQRYFPYNEDENAEQYKKFQQQRQLERDVRSAKRECMAMDSLGDKEGFTKSSVKLKQKQAKLKQYCKDNDLTYKADRTATPGYGMSVSSKVTQASKKDLTNKPFNDIINLQGTLSNYDARRWYIAQDKKIPSMIDRSLSLENQAKQAFDLRNTHRTQTRILMKDQEKRKELDRTDPNKTFEELLESKMKRKHITREEAVQDILNTATKTRESVNKKYGLE